MVEGRSPNYLPRTCFFSFEISPSRILSSVARVSPNRWKANVDAGIGSQNESSQISPNRPAGGFASGLFCGEKTLESRPIRLVLETSARPFARLHRVRFVSAVSKRKLIFIASSFCRKRAALSPSSNYGPGG